MNRILLSLLALLAGALPASATPESKARGELFTRVEGEHLLFIIAIEIDDGFHLYHKELGGKNATGLPLTVTPSGEGLEFDEMQWPEPHRYPQKDYIDGGETYILGHDKHLVLYGRARLAPGAAEKALSVSLNGLTCEDNGSCFPYKETLKTAGRGKDSLWKSYPAALAALSAAPVLEADLKKPAEESWQAKIGFATEPSDEADDDDQNQASGTLYARVEAGRLEFAIDIEIDEGFHLYHKELGGKNATGLPLTVTLSGEGLEFDELLWPKPRRYPQPDYTAGGETYILGHERRLVIYGSGILAKGATEKSLRVDLKGLTCEDNGACYQFAQTLSVSGPGSNELWAARAAVSRESDGDTEEFANEPKQDKGLWALILAAIGGGIFALLMPCTYPMIPITISFFTKQAEARGGNVLRLSLLYGLGIVLIFIVIGLVVGPVILKFATHPITNLVLGSMFVLFAAALFGAITLSPPKSMMRLAGKASMKGGLIGVFLMGMTLVLTSFTCTAPFVGSLLSLAASGGSGIGRVALGMGVFGLTMAVPFTLLALLPGKIQSLPSSGEWMDTLKVSLGFVELAAALKFFSNVDLVWQWQFLSRELFLLLWAGIFVLAGAYLFGWIKMKGHAASEIGPGRMLGAIAFLLLGAYCWHGYRGHRMDSIMTAIIPNYSSALDAEQGHENVIVDDFEAAKASARAQGKPVLINFTGFT
jgi:cytochrome c biogenesis protein CcdA/DsbC/DsbD-like thiol-disulfide interchange protein